MTGIAVLTLIGAIVALGRRFQSDTEPPAPRLL
jgi:hypothetical protein